MGEATINPKALEDAMLKALPSLFPNLLGATDSARVEFYDKFRREVDDHDHEFTKNYDKDLNTTLIFAGLFSAVTSVFLIDIQSKLEPDFQEMSYDLLVIIANASLGNAPTAANAAFPQWDGPEPTIVHVQAILYSSLAASILAAFITMLARQWLNRYARIDMRGSVIDRSQDRQRKMDGTVTWGFDLVMECLPLLLQAALLLSYALSEYLYSINKVVASVVIGFTAFGFLFYLLTVSAATFSYNCPFQTPASLILHFLVFFDDEHKKYLKRSWRWLGRIFRKKRRSRPNPGGLHGSGKSGVFDGSNTSDHIELLMAGQDQPLPLFENETDWDGHVLDSNCIAWMFKMSMDSDVIMAIMRFIPDVVWHAGIRTTPLERLYDTMVECFDFSSGGPVVIPKFRDEAYLSAKALLHLAIQRRCAGDESEKALFKSISTRYRIMGPMHYEGGSESDLESTLGIIDRVFGKSEPMDWKNFSFTVPHHTWMAHILLYRAWDVVKKGEALPDDVKEFVLHSLRLNPPPPAPIVTDCLFVIGLVLGIKFHIDDLLVRDKSHEYEPQITRIYEKLTRTFGNRVATAEEIDRALEAMELITFSTVTNETPEKSYQLFHIFMQTPVSLAFSQEKKWAASRLAMHGAYKWDKVLPWVEDPRDILVFLNHHFDLAAQGSQDQDESIQYALRALAYASSPVTIEALKTFDPTEPSFVRGICYIYQDEKPRELRKAALFLLPLISDRWFNTDYPIMEPDQMRSLCVNWASTVDVMENTYDFQKANLTVFLGMINSPHWRPHIVADKWRLLEYFASLPEDFPPLRRCVDNLELMEEIKRTGNPIAMTLWPMILWLKYKELIPQVQEQLETATKEAARDGGMDLDLYLSTMDTELRKAEDALNQYEPWTTDPPAIALRRKIGNLQQAKDSLAAIKRGGA